MPGRKAQLPEPFTIEKLVSLMDEAGVDRAVIVPPSWPGDRNDYGLEAARRDPKRFAVMGRIPLAKPELAALLPRWREQPGMLGVRLTLHGPQAVLLDSADWFWPAAEKAEFAGHVPCTGKHAEVRANRRTPTAASPDHRSHEFDPGHRQSGQDQGSHRRRGGTRQVSQRSVKVRPRRPTRSSLIPGAT